MAGVNIPEKDRLHPKETVLTRLQLWEFPYQSVQPTRVWFYETVLSNHDPVTRNHLRLRSKQS